MLLRFPVQYNTGTELNGVNATLLLIVKLSGIFQLALFFSDIRTDEYKMQLMW